VLATSKCCGIMRMMKKRMKRLGWEGGGGGDNYLDAFEAHFEPSSS
jgi:hypothetical protein